jgi:hypothetical protein
MEELQQYTRELDLHVDQLQCSHCEMRGQFVSHGFTHKKRGWVKVVTGKRILCSGRHGRSGCGKTRQLHLRDEAPAHQYTTKHLYQFLFMLISLCNIRLAYQRATGTENPRNAYRWIAKCWIKLSKYREVVIRGLHHEERQQKYRSAKLDCLLPTLNALFYILNGTNPCAEYQWSRQENFIQPFSPSF